jgi:NAD(P)-dependent dehydrogenase (short-subunit alcohol dehydrogenase family)
MVDRNSLALIVGAGTGISASVTRTLAKSGFKVALAARNIEKLSSLCEETGARAYAADAANAASVEALFAEVQNDLGPPEVVVYNAAARARGSILDIEPRAYQDALNVNAFGAFLVAQQAGRRMTTAGRGTIIFTGATASVKGFAMSSTFAAGKFAMRGLAQSVARELGPRGIHVAHVIIDGGVLPEGQEDAGEGMLSPEAIAQTYLDLINQPRSAWTHELDLRPWAEKF